MQKTKMNTTLAKSRDSRSNQKGIEVTKKTGKEVQRWADVAMFEAEDIDPEQGIKVSLLSCNNDPLGTIAANALAYKGEFVHSLAEITDETRQHYLKDVPKSVLVMPFEAVNFHFVITGVTRGFTHQMVRQRTAAYAQESMRFAVKETMPVGRPPSLDGTIPWKQFVKDRHRELYPQDFEISLPFKDGEYEAMNRHRREAEAFAEANAKPAQIWRREWDATVENITAQYNALINSGMPAEDARGLAPTSVLTQINYNTSLRGLIDHAGKRLCTQAQFEWREVWAKMIQAIRDYGNDQFYETKNPDNGQQIEMHSGWQFDALADFFRPICYQTGKCEFMAEADRHCDIRERVQANHRIARPSTEWNEEYHSIAEGGSIGPIFPAEWLLNPNAARVSQ